MKTEIINSSVVIIEFSQEKKDEDYGSCLWARFYFDVDNYTLAIDSDCGSYVYSCLPTSTESFIELMLRVNQDYLLCKISSETEIDHEKTFLNIKEKINSVLNEEDQSKIDFENIESACYGGETTTEVASSLWECVKDIHELASEELTLIDEYDIYNDIIETRYSLKAQKIASIYVNNIKPKLKEIVESEQKNNIRT